MKLNHLYLRIAVGVLAAIPCLASNIDLGISGDAQVGPTFINFGNYPLGTVYTPSPGYGPFIVSQQPLSVFLGAGVVSGESGKIQSLNALMTPPGVPLTPDPATSSPFLTFDAGGSNLEVFLTELVQGSTAGPFTLVDTQNGAVATFNIEGFVYNITDHSREDITGTFAATFNGLSVADLVAAGSGPGVETPFSGTFSVTAVPEPTTLLLFGLGFLGFGLLSKRGSRNKELPSFTDR
jgi:hypothetical protein